VANGTHNEFTLQISVVTVHFKRICCTFHLQLECEVSDLKTQKDRELAARDATLAKLKMQLADSLTGNSW